MWKIVINSWPRTANLITLTRTDAAAEYQAICVFNDFKIKHLMEKFHYKSCFCVLREWVVDAYEIIQVCAEHF